MGGDGVCIADLHAVYADGAVLYVFPGLAFGFLHAALHQSFHDINR